MEHQRTVETLVFYASLGHDPQWFPQYLDKERQAGVIRIFNNSVVPGLLQTKEYAKAMISAGDVSDVAQELQRRIDRQEILHRPNPPFLSVLLTQAALEWPVGSPEVMREQLARLLELSERPRIVIRVVPRTWQSGAHVGLDGNFVLLTGEGFGQIAFSESPERGRLVSSPLKIEPYFIRYDRIAAKALTEDESRDLIRRMLEECNAGSDGNQVA